MARTFKNDLYSSYDLSNRSFEGPDSQPTIATVSRRGRDQEKLIGSRAGRKLLSRRGVDGVFKEKMCILLVRLNDPDGGLGQAVAKHPFLDFNRGGLIMELGGWIRHYLVPGGDFYDEAENFHPWPPGGRWEYCNVAYGLLGWLVETLSGSDFLKPSTLDEMFRVQTREAQRVQGITWNAAKSGKWGHGGSDPGINSDLRFILGVGLGAVVFVNTNGVEPHEVTQDLLHRAKQGQFKVEVR